MRISGGGTAQQQNIRVLVPFRIWCTSDLAQLLARACSDQRASACILVELKNPPVWLSTHGQRRMCNFPWFGSRGRCGSLGALALQGANRPTPPPVRAFGPAPLPQCPKFSRCGPSALPLCCKAENFPRCGPSALAQWPKS